MSSRLEDQRAGYCRHCGERLPLIKRVKREEFCSDEHRELFVNSTQSVALDRLRETDPEAQMEPAPRQTTSLAVMEEVVPEPPDPPMAGTIGPRAVDAPLRVVAFFDADEIRIGQWEPVRPEPQWHNIALHFGLAEFYEVAPKALDASAASHTMRAAPDQDPSAPFPELVLPQGRRQVLAEMEALGSADGLEPIGFEDALQPLRPSGVRLNPAATEAHAMARPDEDTGQVLEIDTTLFLPAFSPDAALASLRVREWNPAGWLGLDEAGPGRDITVPVADVDPGEPLDTKVDAELPHHSRCELEPAEWVMPEAEAEAPEEPETAESTEAAPVEMDTPLSVTSDEAAAEFDIDFEKELGAYPAPTRNGWEEIGMSEVLQSTAPSAGLQALGERVSNPFLHEPQPRPGTGKPRWTPATTALGTGAALTTEDWDIL